MYVDSLLLYSDAQALTASGVSTNVVDHETNPDPKLSDDGNVGVGEPMVAAVSVESIDFADADETYEVQLQTSTDEAFTSPITLSTVAITAADGDRVYVDFPANFKYERYTRLNYVLGGTSPALTVTSFLTKKDMVQNEFYYPNNSVIS